MSTSEPETSLPSDHPTVLIIDDEKQIHRFLRPALEAAGYRSLSAADGAEALRLAASQSPDAVLLDLGLPDMDGKLVLEKLRRFSAVPVIVLSARDREAEKIAAFDAGADDYVEKPFGLGELLARLRATLRHGRTGGTLAGADSNVTPASIEKLVIGPVRLDAARHEVRVDGVPVPLSPREHGLLALLMRHEGRIMTHRQLLATVWGPAHVEDVQYLRVYIGHLRQKLGPAAARLIETEPGIGYRMSRPDPDADPAVL
ncbi:response regulator transcription factor [Lichenicola cladoniae]|uniref:Response regulator transcription factor n=1 Tax=Lichenicola cladoniae TaxID=1484109 RepID=A0A6M8HTW2_9PROT|nr:response regulator transcription factor [Lichenicola cladoniae]NPD67726.1 response regulator transcription factor [Acetobacteraceae bacterium]QKE91655.1 response regulator transcription factor [Lichenicola cladoniae]